jgi:hypothetical protein
MRGGCDHANSDHDRLSWCLTASVLKHSIPVCLHSDDLSALGTLGLAFNLCQALVSDERTGLVTSGSFRGVAVLEGP